MEAREQSSPFEGTPWSNDEEIYDFAIKKQQRYECKWDEVVPFLTAEGLDSDYAKSIVDNLKESYESTRTMDKKRKRNVIIFYVILAIVGIFVVRPIAYMISPDYGKYIFMGIVGMGASLFNRYRRDEETQ